MGVKLFIFAVYICISLSCIVTECSITRESLVAKAYACCNTHDGCSAVDKEILRSEMNVYNATVGLDDDLQVLLQRALSGSCARPSSKRSDSSDDGDYVVVDCPVGPYDVAFGPITVTCKITIYLDQGVYFASAYAQGPNNTMHAKSYSDSDAANTTISLELIFTLEQYQAYGNYSVYAYAYGPAYTALTSGFSFFIVVHTENDMRPPILRAMAFRPINSNEITSTYVAAPFGSFHASDDLSGVSSVTVNIYSPTGVNVGYGSWNAPCDTLTSVCDDAKLVSNTFSLYFYSVPVAANWYNLTLYMYDTVGNYQYYSTANLVQIGVQSHVVIASSNCTPGTYLPLNASGPCLPCPYGTYSIAGAFTCKACAPGTEPSTLSASSCTPCPAGRTSLGGDKACTPCPLGTYTSSNGQSYCIPCSPGYYSRTTGSTSCSGCAAGTFSSWGQPNCTPCFVGHYSGDYASGCLLCPPGTYTNSVSTMTCKKCPAGTYGPHAGAVSCRDCKHNLTSPVGSFSSLSCYEPINIDYASLVFN